MPLEHPVAFREPRFLGKMTKQETTCLKKEMFKQITESKKMKKLLFSILFILIAASPAISFENSRDFYIWYNYTQGERIAFLRGVMRTAISFNVIAIDLFGDNNYKNGCKESNKLQKKIMENGDEIYDPLCFGVNNLDDYLPFMAGAITHFYSDPSNRMFDIREIIKISNKKMKGTDVEKIISERRKEIIEFQKKMIESNKRFQEELNERNKK